MKILEKIVPSDPNILAGKPISITKFKDEEVLVYNSISKVWKAERRFPYKGYLAWLSQTGTNAPSSTVLENNMGLLDWVRVDVGHYKVLGDFPIGKTFPYTSNYNTRKMELINNELYTVVGWAAVSGWNENGTAIHLYTQDMDGNPADDILTNYPFELKVYL